MFLVKKLVSPLLYPLPLCLVIALAGIACLWCTRKQRTGRSLVTLGVLGLAVLSYGGMADMIAAPLEDRYPPVNDVRRFRDVPWIVVLAGGAEVARGAPETSWLQGATWSRLMEGIRVLRQAPGAKLVLTGGPGPGGGTPAAAVMADMAHLAGVPGERIVVESRSRDTREHPRYVKPIVGGDPFVLVTSAVHMPRAVALFQAQGLDPMPVPTDYTAGNGEAFAPDALFPDPEAIENVTRAIHEYLGMAWARIRGQV